jgi:hypothetical protein
MLASGVIWKEAPESAIHSVRTGSVTPMVLNVGAGVAGSHSPGQVGGWLGRVGGVEDGGPELAILRMASSHRQKQERLHKHADDALSTGDAPRDLRHPRSSREKEPAPRGEKKCQVQAMYRPHRR